MSARFRPEASLECGAVKRPPSCWIDLVPYRERDSVKLFLLLLLFLPCAAPAAVYEVGPGRPLATISAVPWEALAAGDEVRIHWRAEPYRDKWVICRQGTAASPIVVRGISGPNGEQPVIDGNGATTRRQINFWSEQRGVIKIGGASTPADTMPRHIVIENLEIRSARPPYTYVDDGGATASYVANASAIFLEKGENITIRGCTLHDCGNGLFIASTNVAVSRNILIEGNSIHSNGNEGSLYEHNSYTAGIDLTFQYNHYGPLRAGCLGNNLKDRSAGLVVRYNWIEAGNRQLDLVDAEDSSVIRADPKYRVTWVYGNTLVEPDGAGNRQIIHYGGDSGVTGGYRKGLLHCFHNTIVSTRTDRTTVVRCSTDDERVDLRNNIIYTAAGGNTLALLDSDGVLDLRRNWMKAGWVNSFGGTVTVNNDGTTLSTATPGFRDFANGDYRLTAASPCVDAATAAHSGAAGHPILREYVPHRSSQARVLSGANDVGAYEFSRRQAWREEKFGASAGQAMAADGSDPDADGLTNLMEYAFGTPPLSAGGGWPQLATSSAAGADYPAVTFRRLPAPSEVEYVVQWCGALGDAWTPGSTYRDLGDAADTAVTVEAGRVCGNPLTITVRSTTAIWDAEQQFLRVLVRPGATR